MNISIEKKKAEAISRMNSLHICPEAIRQFAEEGKISISEPPSGAFYRVKEEDMKAIREFEEHYNTLVYLVVRSYTAFGIMSAYLFVGDNEGEWENARAGCRNPQGGVFVYVENDDCSEFGEVGIERTPAAGLIRIW